MAKRKTIGENPLDVVIPHGSGGVAVEEDEPKRGSKKRMTLNVPVDLIEQMKDVIFWTPGMTLAQFAEDAFRESLALIQKKHGKPFPRRKGNLKVGRPIL